MNLNMIRPKIETKDLLSSKTKNCETPIKQIPTKPQETLEFKLTKSLETFSFKPTIPIKGYWTLGLPSLEVYNSGFNITEINTNFELYLFPQSEIGGGGLLMNTSEMRLERTWKF